jgi:intracellular sulfur oxidation DsrE/DsrF family protein
MNILKYLSIITVYILSNLFIVPSLAQSQSTQVVYHIDDTQFQGLKGLRNIRNHLDVSPSTKIVVVTHAFGVDLLMDGAKDQKNQVEYAPLISALKSRGVRFEVCEITLKNRDIKKEVFILEADFTPSGVVRIADLQAKEHFAYIKP